MEKEIDRKKMKSDKETKSLQSSTNKDSTKQKWVYSNGIAKNEPFF